MPFIRFCTTGRIVRPNGTETVTQWDNHTGYKPSQQVIDATIQCYKEQVEAMNSGKVYIDKKYQQEYVTGIQIINGHEYLQ